ncbi:MAG: TRAP transporter substrate-binding protein [Bacillota bacterium]
MKKGWVILSMVLVLVLLFAVGCGGSKTGQENKPAESQGPAKQESRVIKVAHVVNEQDPYHVAALKFKELVEAKTAGNIKVEVYPNAVLGDERTLLEGMQVGTIDMGVITNGPVANFLPKIAVFEMPFLFSKREDAYAVLDGPIGQNILKELESVKLKGLAYAERGFRNLTNSKRPVLTPADVKGLKLRVMQNPVYIDLFNTLGANAVPMAWPEALTALQQGTIDGQENPVNVAYAFKLYETQKHLSMTRHTYAPALFVMSLDVFNKNFTPETQQILVEAAKEAGKYVRNWIAENEEKQLKEVEEKGLQVHYPELAPFKEAVKPVYQKYSDRFGNLISEIEAQLSKK